jgi:hypothetical protein
MFSTSTKPSDKISEVSIDSEILDLISSSDFITNLSITAEMFLIFF